MAVQRFYHAIPGSSFVTAKGAIRTFYNGELEVDSADEDTMEFLAGVADKPGTMISSAKEKAKQDKLVEVAAEANKAAAAKVLDSLATSKTQ